MCSPGYRDRQPAGKTRPCTRGARCQKFAGAGTRNEFDYNRHPLNTMPDTWLTRLRSCRRSRLDQLSPAARQTLDHPHDEAATRATRQAAREWVRSGRHED